MPTSPHPVVFRSVLGWVWLGLAAAVSVFLVADMAVRASAWDAFLVAPWLAAVVWLVWIFQTAPRIVADARGVRFHNVLRIVDVPWSAVRSLRLRYSVELTLRSGGTVTAWGGASRRMHRSLKRQDVDPAELQVESLEQLHAQAEEGPADVRRGWDWPAVATGAVIVVWIAFSLGVTGGFVVPGAA
ncbi:PH domain-containing protein [Microbacterium excoecariae]|uniref:PH domain-containing protein n=1 Tax=Microbacterium excoecariae TaxID=2715210 RepID=UPI0014087F68|nr:PH domain-containing protein [Microbacterium excoecariae]NHI17316.1 PH domain-containing protein [Microbacterium excoecariae]